MLSFKPLGFHVLTTEKAMHARAVKLMLIFVASMNFLVLSTNGPRAPAPMMPNTMKRAPQTPAKSCRNKILQVYSHLRMIRLCLWQGFVFSFCSISYLRSFCTIKTKICVLPHHHWLLSNMLSVLLLLLIWCQVVQLVPNCSPWRTTWSLILWCSYICVSLHTQDLLQQRGEAGEDSNARTEAQQQDDVGFVLQ